MSRSRVVWVSAIDSTGPSNATVCMPGAEPARLEAMSIGPPYPRAVMAFRIASAVPEGASSLAAWCSSWM